MAKPRHARPSRARKAAQKAAAAAVPSIAGLAIAAPAYASTPARSVHPEAGVAVLPVASAVLIRDEKPATYTVAPGDSLSLIAGKHCGNPADWTGIFEASKNQIKNPDIIYPGQHVTLDCREVKVFTALAVPDAVTAHTTAAVSGGVYSFTALEHLWEDAGGPAWAASPAAAVAECESGGRTDAYNPSGASGLWQILGEVVPGNVFDPMVNAENAVAKFKASGDTFAQWVCKP